MRKSLAGVMAMLVVLLMLTTSSAYAADAMTTNDYYKAFSDWRVEPNFYTKQNNTTLQASIKLAGVNDHLYAFMINAGTTSHPYQKFSTTTRTWSSISAPSSSGGTNEPGIVAVGDIVYFFGGSSGINTTNRVYAYDTTTHTWRYGISTMPIKGSKVLAAAIDQKIYVLNGTRLDCYDAESNTWTNRTASPYSGAIEAVSANGKIYTLDGKNLYCYDPHSNTWGTTGELPAKWNRNDIVAVDNDIYYITAVGNAMWRYDTVANEWTVAQVLPSVGRISNTLQTIFISYCSNRLYAIHVGEHSAGEFIDAQIISVSMDDLFPKNKTTPEPQPDMMNLQLASGATTLLSVTESPGDNANYIWASGDPAVAIVSADGTVTGAAPGTCIIQASDESGIVSQIKICVYQADEPDPEITYTKVNDNDPAVTYSGEWHHVPSHPDFYQNDEYYSNQPGAFAEFSFSGVSIKYIAATSNNLGICDIYLDGELAQAGLDLYAAGLEGQKELFSKDGLENGPHTLKIVVTGNKNDASEAAHVTIDAFEYGTIA